MRHTIIAMWLLTCLLYTIDTDVFLFASLSQTLLGGMCALMMCVFSLAYGLLNGASWPAGKGVAFVFIWIAYLLCHASLVAEAEQYKLFYLVIQLVVMLMLSFLLHNRFLSFRQIENGLLLMLFLQLSCLLLQTMGFMDSSNPYFRLTGFGDNPNSVAILIAISIPFLFDRLKESEHTKLILLSIIVAIIYLFVLKCRTAFIGLGVICLTRFAFSFHMKKRYMGLGKNKMTVTCLVAMIVMIVISLALYRMKQDSADGRLLVWKISAKMVADKPLGWGVGMFGKNYNLCQGKYFEAVGGSEQERTLADIVNMAYNDYLEQGVESGILGAFFLITFYITMIVLAIKKHETKALSVFCAFAVMSMISFVYASIQAWMVMISFAALMLCDERQTQHRGLGVLLSMVCIALCAVILLKYGGMTQSQRKLQSYKTRYEQNESLDVNEIKKLEKPISTSSEYYLFLADVLMAQKRYGEAYSSIKRASLYSTEPKVFFLSFICLERMGRTAEGVKYIRTFSDIVPQNMTSRNILLKWYDSRGMIQEALNTALEMSQTKLKVNNPHAKQIQAGAMYYLEVHRDEMHDYQITK